MSHRTRHFLRWIIFIISLSVIIYCQRTTGMKELGFMLLGLVGILAVLYDYNRDFTHPKRNEER